MIRPFATTLLLFIGLMAAPLHAIDDRLPEGTVVLPLTDFYLYDTPPNRTFAKKSHSPSGLIQTRSVDPIYYPLELQAQGLKVGDDPIALGTGLEIRETLDLLYRGTTQRWLHLAVPGENSVGWTSCTTTSCRSLQIMPKTEGN